MRSASLLWTLFLVGCSSDSEPYLWAMDSLWLADNEGETYGFHTWTIYDESWRGPDSESHHICSVVVSLSATPTPPCSSCVYGWELFATNTSSDCDMNIVSSGDWTTIRRVGFKSSGPVDVPNSPTTASPVWITTKDVLNWQPYGWYESGSTQALDIQSPWVWKIRMMQ